MSDVRSSPRAGQLAARPAVKAAVPAEVPGSSSLGLAGSPNSDAAKAEPADSQFVA